MASKKKVDAWAEAKRLCRLSAEDIAKAKALGFQPKSLIKNIPSRSQPWKAPVREWVRDLYEEKFGDRPALTRPAPASPAQRQPAPNRPPEPDVRGDADADEVLDQDTGFSEEDRDVLRKRRNWIEAAKFVAWEMRKLAWVERVALFGSLAGAPTGAPYSGKRKLWPGATLHDPKDIDIAVWLTDLGDLRALQKARVKGLQRLLEKANVGVAHHQVDVFVIEPDTDRYLGRLCTYKTCPFEGKAECRVPGCGVSAYLQQHEGFTLAADALQADRIRVLFDRRTLSAGAITERPANRPNP